MQLRQIERLDECYRIDTGTLFITGLQALVRLLLTQSYLDRRAGLKTAGFVSGYRGSPLGGLDRELWRAQKFLDAGHIHFQPGLNEDLAATSIWGSQQTDLFAGARYDGVFSMWYGKGPGVDRSGDAFKHGNAAGTSARGGVLVVAGDDHTCKSSSLPHQSEYSFIDAMIPVLAPADVQEIVEFGLYGIALSRFSGCWVGLKVTQETADATQTIVLDPDRFALAEPQFDMPPGGLNIRWPDPPNDQEFRLQRYKLKAALAFARSNKLNRTVIDGRNPRFGIVTSGKAHLDALQALEDLGIDRDRASEIGIKLFKVGHELAARVGGDPSVRRRPRGNRGRRGEARGRRKPAQGAALQLARELASADHRQARRARRVDVALQRRAHAGVDCACARKEDAAVSLEP